MAQPAESTQRTTLRDRYGTSAAPISPSTLIGEFSGSALLIGAFGFYAIYSGQMRSVTAVALAFGVGLFLAALIWQGVHGNPLVSLGAAIAGRISWLDAGARCVIQLLGYMTAIWVTALLNGIDRDDRVRRALYGVPLPLEPSTWQTALLVGAAAGFGFVLAALASGKLGRFGSAALVGFALYLAIYYSASLAGGGVNTARDIAPMILSGVWYWPGPLGELLGAGIAGAVYRIISRRRS